jgi:hypothetical protein
VVVGEEDLPRGGEGGQPMGNGDVVDAKVAAAGETGDAGDAVAAANGSAS